MTIDTRRAPGRRQRAQRPCFLFGAKEASAGEEYRGIRQRFPYRCNETKTSRAAGQRSPWSPRRRHHQSLWQAKTTFVRITCTSSLPSNFAVVGSLLAKYLGRGPGPLYIGLATTIARGSDGERPEHTQVRQAQEHLNLRRLFFPLYYSSSTQEAIHHQHTGVGYYTTTVARTSINLVSLYCKFMEFMREILAS